MENVTLTIALFASVMVFLTSPVFGLIIYVAALAWYPSYLPVSIGTIDFTVRRIVILAVLGNVFLQTSLPKKFKFIWLDKLVIIYFVAQVVSNAFMDSAMQVLVNRAGAAFDMVLPYFAVRLIITNKEQYLTLLKGILIVAAPLAIMGLYQCLTADNPVGFLLKYHAWRDEASRGYVARARHGFYRANVTFSVSIMYGLFFAMLGPVCAGLIDNMKKHKKILLAAIALTGIGVFASMSSGPMLAMLLAGLFMVFYRYRKYWKTVVISIVVMCGIVEVISNRHFYDVLGGFTLNPRSAWYRSKIIEVALFEGGMSGHWLTGYGLATDPGWSAVIDQRDHTDIVNHYILILCRFGLIGLIPFLVMNVEVWRRLIAAYSKSRLKSDRWLVWCLSGSIFGLAAALVTVSLFDQASTVFYLMIGFAGVMPTVVHSSNVRVYREQVRLAQQNMLAEDEVLVSV